MTKGFMSDREKALEESYFRQQDARLLEKLRKGATLDEIALALRDKLDVDNPELLARAREAGVTPETAPAFLLAPLIQVAWAEGKVGRHEREAVLRLAHERGVASGTPAHDQLVSWLEQKPSDALFDTALEVIRAGFEVLPHAVLRRCHIRFGGERPTKFPLDVVTFKQKNEIANRTAMAESRCGHGGEHPFDDLVAPLVPEPADRRVLQVIERPAGRSRLELAKA